MQIHIYKWGIKCEVLHHACYVLPRAHHCCKLHSNMRATAKLCQEFGIAAQHSQKPK